MPTLWKPPTRLRLKNKPRALTLAAVLVIVISGVTVAAQSSGATLVRWVIANEGRPASAGPVTINDTLGQPITGASVSSDGRIVLGAGYWPSVSAAPATPGDQHVYLPLLQR